MLTDERQRELMKQARRGTPAQRERALSALLADFRGPALATIHRTLASASVDSQQAQDVLGAATVRFITSGLDAYRGEASPRSFFVRIAVNAAIDAIRLSRRTAGLSDELADAGGLVSLRTTEMDPERQLGELQQRLHLSKILRLCLDRLGDRYRDAVDRYYFFQQGSCAECASTLGISALAFMQRLSRARQLLGRCIRAALEDGRRSRRDSK